MHICTSPKSTISQDSPGSDTPQHQLTTRPVQQIQDRHSWFTRGRSAGATAPTILSSRPSATLEAITRTDSAAYESAGRYMTRLVTTCITGRRPQTPAGATCREPSTECMLTASQPHVDPGLAQPIAEKSPHYTRIYLCDFALMTNLSFRVIKEESQHHPTALGAIHH